MNRQELKEAFKEYNERELCEKERKLIRRVTKKALIRLGARTDFAGFDTVCVAVELVIEEPNLLRHVCKKLYPLIADLLDEKNGSTVERNIRNLIEEISDQKSFCELNRMFQVNIFAVDDKPTVSELIRLLAEFYLLELWR